MKILLLFKNTIAFLLLFTIEPFFIIKLLYYQSLNKNKIINYLKEIKPVFSIKNINIYKLYRILFQLNKKIFRLNNCLIINGCLFVIFKKYITENITLVMYLKKEDDKFKGHCIVKYNNNSIIENEFNNNWKEIFRI